MFQHLQRLQMNLFLRGGLDLLEHVGIGCSMLQSTLT